MGRYLRAGDPRTVDSGNRWRTRNYSAAMALFLPFVVASMINFTGLDLYKWTVLAIIRFGFRWVEVASEGPQRAATGARRRLTTLDAPGRKALDRLSRRMRRSNRAGNDSFFRVGRNQPIEHHCFTMRGQGPLLGGCPHCVELVVGHC